MKRKLKDDKRQKEEKMLQKSYKQNIWLSGATEFFSFFGITNFWLVFLSQHGMSLWQIGLLESIFHLTSFLSEVPSGLLADRFSYKSNLILSRSCTILSAICMLLGQGNFYLYALGMVIGAWSYNFDSGTSSAMLYESVKEAGLEDSYLKYSTIISSIVEGSRTLGIVVAGFFIHGLLDATYMIQITLSLIGMFFIFLMKEPVTKQKNEVSPTLKTLIQTVVSSFKTNPKLLNWMIWSQLVGTLLSMFYFYYQNEITDLASWQISLVMLISSGMNIGAVWLANLVGKRWTAKQVFPILSLAIGLLYLLSGWQSSILYVLIYLLSDSLYALFLPIYGNDLQKELDSRVRATMLSVNSMFFSLSMILIFPLIGLMIDFVGFAISFVSLGIILLVLSLIMLTLFKD